MAGSSCLSSGAVSMEGLGEAGGENCGRVGDGEDRDIKLTGRILSLDIDRFFSVELCPCFLILCLVILAGFPV